VVLAIYSVAVFATLAGSLGAYFLRDPLRGTDAGPTVENQSRQTFPTDPSHGDP
jgi:hypothetical protein